MSCAVCDGHPCCPCCSTGRNMTPCPECDGIGYTYYDEDGDVITQEEYNQLPPQKTDKEPCNYCEGTGEIEYDNEPDYDDYS